MTFKFNCERKITPYINTMKKIIILIASIFLLASCGMTQEEKLNKIEECKAIWYWYYLNGFDEINCSSSITTRSPVMDCIKEYTNWLDEKYNNPDHVTNLREDNYSNVVKTCNEIFWTK